MVPTHETDEPTIFSPDWILLAPDSQEMASIRHSASQSVQSIRAQKATLGASANSEQPMDRIAQHLGICEFNININKIG